VSARRLVVEVSSDATEDALDRYIRHLIEDVQAGGVADLESPRILLDVVVVEVLEPEVEAN
jgi:hypothetical protein